MGVGMERTHFDVHTRLTADQHRLLGLVAEVERTTREAIIQRALTEYLREHAPAALAHMARELKRGST